MGRLFDDNSSQYLRASTAMFATMPFAVFARFKMNEWRQGENYTLAVAYEATYANYWALLLLAQLPDFGFETVFVAKGSGTGSPINTHAAAALNVWGSACGIAAGSGDQRAYINGTNNQSQGTSAIGAITGLTTFDVGGWNEFATYWTSGAIGEVAVYDLSGYAGATGTDKADTFESDVLPGLSAGHSPMLYAGLIHYYPLGGGWGNNDNDHKGSAHMTAVNDPTWTDHPEITWPRTWSRSSRWLPMMGKPCEPPN